LHELRAAQAGDRAAAEQLLTRYRDRLLQIVSLLMARRRGDLLEDEEDIVQDTLLEAFLNLEGFEPRSEGAFLHWLARIAENKLRDSVRRQERLKRGGGRVRPRADLSAAFLLSSLVPGKEPTPSQAAGAQELTERVESALIALPERERRVFVLRRLCGLSNEEVAAELGLGGASSARSLYSRTLARLSSLLPELAG